MQDRPSPSVLTRAARGFDRVVRRALLERSPKARARSRAESLGHEERMEALARIAELYDRPEHFSDPSPFFPSPGVPTATSRSVGSKAFGSGERAHVLDLEWPSDTRPHLEDLASRYSGHVENSRARARLFTVSPEAVKAGRPAVILVHGYRAGQLSVEERVWPVAWLLQRGFDVALAVLPFHASRAPKNRGPLFPSSDPRFTNEGFRQAIYDLRGLAALLRARGATSVGVMGMSLGGYTTALLATVEPDLAFAVPMIPVASLADMARHGDRFVGTPAERDAQHQALDVAHRVVSPLARPSKVAPERVLVIGGEGDDITPLMHAERLAEHFAAPLTTFSGGHILQFGRASAFRRVGRLLTELGLGRAPTVRAERSGR